MSHSSVQKATVQRTAVAGKPASGIRPAGKTLAGKLTPAIKTIAGKTLADFRAAHDPNVRVPAKIKKALDDMLAEGKETWEYETDLMRRANVSTTDLARFRPMFEAHIVETNGRNSKRVWFASVKVAEEARGC